MPLQIMRPESIREAPMATGNALGTAGTTFYIIVQQHEPRGQAQPHHTTADGDAGFDFETGVAKHAFSLNGVAIADQSIGFGYLQESNRIPLTLRMDAKRELFGTVTVVSYNAKIDQRAQIVPIALAGYFHGMPIERVTT